MTCHQGFKRTRLKPVRVCCWHVAGCRPTDFSVGLQLKGLTTPFTNKFQLLSTSFQDDASPAGYSFEPTCTQLSVAAGTLPTCFSQEVANGFKVTRCPPVSALASTCRLHVADQRPVSALVPSQHWLWHSSYLPPCPSYLPTHPPTYLPTKQLANQPKQPTHPPTHPPNQPTKHKTRTNQGREGKAWKQGTRQEKARENKGNCSLSPTQGKLLPGFFWTQSIL